MDYFAVEYIRKCIAQGSQVEAKQRFTVALCVRVCVCVLKVSRKLKFCGLWLDLIYLYFALNI